MFSSCLDHLKAQPLWIILISCLGFFSLIKNSTSLLTWIYNILLRPPKDLRKYGAWALITGATDGIGKAFAFKLAEKGLNLILVSRDPSKLKRVSSEIRNKHPNIDVKIFQLDFSGDVAAGVIGMKEAIKGLDVGVLVNNAGVTYPEAMYFHEVDEKIWMNLVRVNLVGTTYVTGAVVPGMVARGRGAVVNIGSGASVVVPSHPLYAIYAATKGYIDQLSRSLYVEYKHYGIDVQCQVPLYVSTKLLSQVAGVGKSSLFIPSAETYVESAIRFIGHDQPRCTPYWTHSIQWFFATLVPDALLDSWRLSVALKRMNVDIPRR